MKIIEDQTRKDGITCIKFKKRTNEANYLDIKNDNGCWSHIGKFVESKPQVLSLDTGVGCVTLSIVIHELVHALMFEHEHKRPDRDEWIEIIEENIIPCDLKFFKIIVNLDNNLIILI